MAKEYDNNINVDILGDAIAGNPSMNSLDEHLIAEESLEGSNTLKKQIGFFQGFTLMIGISIIIIFFTRRTFYDNTFWLKIPFLSITGAQQGFFWTRNLPLFGRDIEKVGSTIDGNGIRYTHGTGNF